MMILNTWTNYKLIIMTMMDLKCARIMYKKIILILLKSCCLLLTLYKMDYQLFITNYQHVFIHLPTSFSLWGIFSFSFNLALDKKVISIE